MNYIIISSDVYLTSALCHQDRFSVRLPMPLRACEILMFTGQTCIARILTGPYLGPWLVVVPLYIVPLVKMRLKKKKLFDPINSYFLEPTTYNCWGDIRIHQPTQHHRFAPRLYWLIHPKSHSCFTSEQFHGSRMHSFFPDFLFTDINPNQ